MLRSLGDPVERLSAPRPLLLLLACGLLSWGLALSGCSPSSSAAPATDAGPACNSFPAGCTTPGPATTQLTTPAVSFASDILPIFQGSGGCAASTSCHGDMDATLSGLYLGGTTSVVVAAIVNVKSQELPTMNYVTPGDIANSYIIHKMDGSICQFHSSCSNAPQIDCGMSGPGTGGMPELSCPLPDATIDTMRRWVAQGAMDN
jgi:hypothetical protein